VKHAHIRAYVLQIFNFKFDVKSGKWFGRLP